MSRTLVKFLALCLALVLAIHAPMQGAAQSLRALAQVDGANSSVELGEGAVTLRLDLSQPVPFRVFTLVEPARLVLDFREVDWRGVDRAAILPDAPERLRFGTFQPGWSRLVLDLPGNFAVAEAGMKTGQGGALGGERALLSVKLEPVDPTEMSRRSGANDDAALWAMKRPTAIQPPVAPRRQDGSRPLVVMLDPGHGGVDPGALRHGATEKELTLQFALELKELLVREGGMEVHLSRTEDIFVPLQRRVSLARALGADVFVSIHADALAKGRASGTTIYTLSESASDNASSLLASREDRADLISGIDLKEQDDPVASVLMDLARRETNARSQMLAKSLVTGIRANLGHMHKRPHLSAGFSVLKAPDIPSVLIELGFISSANDLARIQDPEWRARLGRGILTALNAWAVEDAAAARLVRQ